MAQDNVFLTSELCQSRAVRRLDLKKIEGNNEENSGKNAAIGWATKSNKEHKSGSNWQLLGRGINSVFPQGFVMRQELYNMFIIWSLEVSNQMATLAEETRIVHAKRVWPSSLRSFWSSSKWATKMENKNQFKWVWCDALWGRRFWLHRWGWIHH